MKPLTLTIATVVVVSGAVTAAAFADNHKGRKNDRRASMMERVDTNKDGKVTLEEMVQSASARFKEADKNTDGEISAEEMTDVIERRRNERRAARMMQRLDYDGDGKVTIAEIENRTKKRFALMDANDDGVVEASEMSRRGFGMHRGERRGWRRGHRNND